MPLISVIMACYNAEVYLKKTIRSLLLQSFQDFELIFVDDCSTDKSIEIATVLAKDDARIRILKMERKSGPAAVRNFAIAHAKGEWLAIMDADDIWLPDKLKRQVEIAENATECLVLIGTGCHLIDKLGCRIKSYSYPTSSDELKRNLLDKKAFPPHSSLMYRASAINKTTKFNPRFLRSEDYELWLRLSEIGDFSSCLLPLVEYRIHQQSISFNRSIEGYKDLDYAIAARVCQMLRNSDFPDPSVDGDETMWQKFMRYISEIIEASKIQNYISFKKESKHAVSVTTFHNFIKLVLSPDFVILLSFLLWSFLQRKTIHFSLVNQCFESWIISEKLNVRDE